MLKKEPSRSFAGSPLLNTVAWYMHATNVQIKPIRTSAKPRGLVVDLATKTDFDRRVGDFRIDRELFDCLEFRQHCTSPWGWSEGKHLDQNLTKVGKNCPKQDEKRSR